MIASQQPHEFVAGHCSQRTVTEGLAAGDFLQSAAVVLNRNSICLPFDQNAAAREMP
jgi:hypothetical protein